MIITNFKSTSQSFLCRIKKGIELVRCFVPTVILAEFQNDLSEVMVYITQMEIMKRYNAVYFAFHTVWLSPPLERETRHILCTALILIFFLFAGEWLTLCVTSCAPYSIL